METSAYEEMAQVQRSHWWFKARREILADQIKRLGLDKNADLLEIGCGPGGNIEMLKEFGNVSAIELDDFAREYATGLTGVKVVRDQLPTLASISQQFDLVCMFDVLEHVEEDDESLAALKKALKPEGTLLLTVPAYQWLFGRHDEILHHRRRYSRAQLEKKLLAAGYRIRSGSYFNSLLFPVVAVTRLIELVLKPESAVGSKMPGRLLNAIFYRIFKLELWILRLTTLAFGTSIIVAAQSVDGKFKSVNDGG